MSEKVYNAGDEIDSYCTTCKAVVAHRVFALVGDVSHAASYRDLAANSKRLPTKKKFIISNRWMPRWRIFSLAKSARSCRLTAARACRGGSWRWGFSQEPRFAWSGWRPLEIPWSSGSETTRCRSGEARPLKSESGPGRPHDSGFGPPSADRREPQLRQEHAIQCALGGQRPRRKLPGRDG